MRKHNSLIFFLHQNYNVLVQFYMFANKKCRKKGSMALCEQQYRNKWSYIIIATFSLYHVSCIYNFLYIPFTNDIFHLRPVRFMNQFSTLIQIYSDTGSIGFIKYTYCVSTINNSD